MLVDVSDVETRFPRPLMPDEKSRLSSLLSDAEELIKDEFLKAGRDFYGELKTVKWLPSTAARVIREMVSAAILVGGNAGARTVSSTSGPQSDMITFADVNSVGWGGVRLTDQWRKELGLAVSARPTGSFPDPAPWPELKLCEVPVWVRWWG